MKALFTGLGSIGTRHLRNLSALCERRGVGLEVTALRGTDRALPDDVARLVARQVRTLAPDEMFDIAFITGPTSLHATTVGLLAGRVGCFFIEKPVFDHTDYDLEALGLDAGQKAYVAAPMRWCGVYLALKTALAGLPVYSARAICSSYLPDWRPGADYRDIYSARRDMGGGVALDLIHEWDYLVDLFGWPDACHALRGKFSDLEIDSDDLAVYIAAYPGLLCELHLDYFGRTPRRELQLFIKEGCLVADFQHGTLALPDGTVRKLAEDVNRRYEREMEYFLEYAREGEGESVNSPARALRVLQVGLGGQPCKSES